MRLYQGHQGRRRDDTQPERRHYRCHGGRNRFDDLTDTSFADHHQPLRVWVLCQPFMGMNLANERIAVAGPKGHPAAVRKTGDAVAAHG